MIKDVLATLPLFHRGAMNSTSREKDMNQQISNLRVIRRISVSAIRGNLIAYLAARIFDLNYKALVSFC